MARCPSEDHDAVSAAAAAVLARAIDVEDMNAPLWLPYDEYASEVLFDVTSSRRALSIRGHDDQRFAHLLSIFHTAAESEEFGRGMTAF